MPREGRNTFALTADGYVLPSGKILSREDALLIGQHAGLPTSRVGDTVYLKEECPGGMMTVEQNPIYRPFIDENNPLPPMLQFFTTGICNSSYTINLNTFKATRNSPIQKGVPEYIRTKLQ